MRTTVSERGQITVPKRLRERLGIRPGDQLELSERDGTLVARKALPADPVIAVFGILRADGDTDATIRQLRGEPDAV
jgi:AbrB family looped-hinge helix DNA binding protein